MVSKYEASFTGMFDGVDEMIRTTDNPRHKQILLNYRRHGLLEVSQRWDELLDPAMTVEHPVYRMNEGPSSILLDGREMVESFYRDLVDSGASVLWPTDQKVAVSDWGFAAEATFLHFVPGKLLAAAGEQIDDPDATYLVKHLLAMFWPYAEDGRLIGEHVYEDGTSREIMKPDPEDVITPADARSLLEPVLENAPA